MKRMMKLRDEEGNVVEEWVSSKEEHVIYGLPEGSYTLHEELAPYEDGYVSASDVMFEVKEDGSVTKVEMKDEYSKVEISKTDLTTGKELEGAKLQIIRKDGTVLEEWITDGKPHSVEKLPVNEELTLREITAPDGYEIAEDVTFTLKDTMEVQKVEMKDDVTKVEISKVDMTDGSSEVEGAKLYILNENNEVITRKYGRLFCLHWHLLEQLQE